MSASGFCSCDCHKPGMNVSHIAACCSAAGMSVETKLDRLHSWDGLMSLLDEHWPEDIFPTLEDDPDRDTGPRIISLLRWVDQLRAELERLRPRRIEAVAELMAVPPETIVKTEGGSVACRHYDGIHGVVFGDDRPFNWECLSTELPGIVLWTPEVQ